MEKKDNSSPIRAKLKFKKNKIEHWSCESSEQLGKAIAEDFENTGRVPLSIQVRKEAKHV